MDAEKCQVLLYALQQGSLTAAAEKLGYTTSGISRIVASLEEEAGFPLLLRGKRGVEPTWECRQLLPLFEEAVRLQQRFLQQSAQISGLEVGSVRVGTAYYEYYGWLSRVIASYSQAHPGITVSVEEGPSTALCHAIAQHRMDLCIVSHREGDFEWILLKEDPLVAVVSPEHPLAHADVYPMKNFARDPYIGTYPGEDTDITRALRANHIVPDVRYTTGDIRGAAAMVSAGLGVTLLNALLTRNLSDEVCILPLDPSQTVQIGVAVSRNASSAAKEFAKLLKQRIHEL